MLSLRLMDDIEVPQMAKAVGPGWHYFSRPQNQSFDESQNRDIRSTLSIQGSVMTARADVSAGLQNSAGIPMLASYLPMCSPQQRCRCPVDPCSY